MAINFHTNGDFIDADETNQDNQEALMIGCQEHVRTLIDRATTYGKDFKDVWGDAVVGVTGATNTRNTSIGSSYNAFCKNYTVPATSMTYTVPYSDSIMPGFTDTASGDTTHDPDSMSNAANCFDSDDTTFASFSTSSNGTYTKSLGKTFAAKTIKYVYLKAYVTRAAGTAADGYIRLQSYNGSTWADEITLSSSAVSSSGAMELSTLYYLNKSVQGLRISAYSERASGTIYFYYYFLRYTTLDLSASEIPFTIPTGTFAADVSSTFFKSLVYKYETGASLQYKISNGSEDSGYFSDGAIGNFTAFTSEPTTLTVKLTPKSSSPTAGYPAIYGVAGRSA
jgi:hypothetical protein